MATATATHHAAYARISERKVRAIKSVDYTLEDFQKFEVDILRAGNKVPSRKAKGKVGHNWLLLELARVRKLAKDEDIDFTECELEELPAAEPNILGNDSHASIAMKTSELATKTATYYTERGAIEGFRDLIVANVPKATISELADRQYEFEQVDPKDLLDHLRAACEKVDIMTVKDMLEARNVPMDFEGEESLKEFFKDIDEMIKRLSSDHKITTSTSELIVNYLFQIETHGGTIFDKHLTTWRARTTKDDAAEEWKDFKNHWAKADKERRVNLKLNIKKGDGVTFGESKHQANAVNQQDIVAMIAAGFSTMAEATQETIKESVNAAVEKRMAGMSQGGGGGGGNNKESSEADNLKNQLKALQRKYDAALKQGKAGEKETGSGDEERKRCRHCNAVLGRDGNGKFHPRDESKCWKLKDNREKASEAWRKANPE